MIIFAADAFAEQYVGGAELTTESIIKGSKMPIGKMLCSVMTPKIMQKYKDSFWVFGNFSALSEDCILFAIKNLNYSVLE